MDVNKKRDCDGLFYKIRTSSPSIGQTELLHEEPVPGQHRGDCQRAEDQPAEPVWSRVSVRRGLCIAAHLLDVEKGQARGRNHHVAGDRTWSRYYDVNPAKRTLALLRHQVLRESATMPLSVMSPRAVVIKPTFLATPIVGLRSDDLPIHRVVLHRRLHLHWKNVLACIAVSRDCDADLRRARVVIVVPVCPRRIPELQDRTVIEGKSLTRSPRLPGLQLRAHSPTAR